VCVCFLRGGIGLFTTKQILLCLLLMLQRMQWTLMRDDKGMRRGCKNVKRKWRRNSGVSCGFFCGSNRSVVISAPVETPHRIAEISSRKISTFFTYRISAVKSSVSRTIGTFFTYRTSVLVMADRLQLYSSTRSTNLVPVHFPLWRYYGRSSTKNCLCWGVL